MAKKTTQEAVDQAITEEKEKVEAKQAELDSANTAPLESADFGDGWNVDDFERASRKIWKPRPGQFVLGYYDGNSEFEGDYDKPVKVHFIIDKDTGNRISFVGGQMCDLFICEEAQIEKGDRVFIRYEGQSKTRKDQKVNDFDIRYQRK